MSVANELEKLHQLHASGGLTNAEFESAKASVLAAGGQSAAIMEQSNKAPPVRPTRTPRWVTWILAFAILFAGAWILLRQLAGERTANNFVATLVRAPISLRDEVQSLPASSWKALPLTLPYTGELSVNVQVVRGNPVEVFVVDDQNLKVLQAKGTYKHFAAFAANESRAYQRSAHLNQGTYFLVLRDNTLGLLSSSTSDVKVVAKLGP